MTGGYSSTEDELLTDTSDDDSETEQEFRRSTWKRLRRRVRTPVETAVSGLGLPSAASPRASQGYSSTDGGTTDDTGSDSETDEMEQRRRMTWKRCRRQARRMDLWAAIPELSVDAGPVTQAQPERVRAERAAPAPAARRVEALMSGFCTSMAQESALEAYNSGRRAAAGGVWRTFLLAPSHDTECSLLAPAAAADKAHAALLAVRQRQMLVYALHGRLGRESPAFALPFDLARMVDEWMPVLPCADTLRRYLEQGVHNEAARLDAAAAAMHIRPVNPTLAFWADEETRYALERMAGKRARNTRWAELSQRRAHLATGTQRWPPRKDACGNAAPEGEEGREQETPRGELRWPERDERMLSFGRCEAGATTPKWGVSTTRRYAIGAEYRSLVTEFLERHAQSFVQVEFELDWTDPTGSEGGAEGPEGQEVAAGVEGRALLPTVRALDQSGAKVECFRPRRVHIDGW